MIEYRLLRSKRRTIAIRITPGGEVEVRCPLKMPEAAARSFVESKAGWIREKLEKMADRPRLPKLTEAELDALGENARHFFGDRAAYFAPRVGVDYGRITIRCQKTRWGSCSSKGNLNFNCLLMLAPEDVRDYVVVHELCHRREMNHSPRFWAEVERVLPGYRVPRQWLGDHGNELLGRLEESSIPQSKIEDFRRPPLHKGAEGARHPLCR